MLNGMRGIRWYDAVVGCSRDRDTLLKVVPVVVAVVISEKEVRIPESHRLAHTGLPASLLHSRL